MGAKAFFKRRSYAWRIRHYIDTLEEEIDERPQGYENVRTEFNYAIQHYSTAKLIYGLISAVFYASIVTSITASVGYQINLFEKISGILGFSTVFLLYLISRYLLRIERADLENSRSRILAYLTHAELGEDWHRDTSSESDA